jgi:hypothetical protein
MNRIFCRVRGRVSSDSAPLRCLVEGLPRRLEPDEVAPFALIDRPALATKSPRVASQRRRYQSRLAETARTEKPSSHAVQVQDKWPQAGTGNCLSLDVPASFAKRFAGRGHLSGVTSRFLPGE